MWRIVRYWLYVGHRWLGILSCLLFTVWFASGLVMAYVGFPELNEQQRVESLAPVDWSRVQLDPQKAMDLGGLSEYPRSLRIEMLLGQPVYRIVDWDGTRNGVYAADGSSVGLGASQLCDALTGEPMALTDDAIFKAAHRLLPGHAMVMQERQTQEDLYWYSHHDHRPLPVLRVRFDDPQQTWAYLDPSTATVIETMDEGHRHYRWWFNALHRLDFYWLMQRPLLWYSIIWLLAGSGLVIATSGIVIGWRRLKRKVVIASLRG